MSAGDDLPVRILHPEPARLTIGEAADSLQLSDRAPGERPYVVANMVVTADGRATIEGRSGPIGGEADHALFHALRARVDAVMAGTGTLRVEHYGRLVRDPAARRARAARGLAEDPLGVTVTRSGDVPLEIPLFADPDSTVVVFSETELATSTAQADVRLEPLPGASLGPALGVLRARYGVRSLLCEGGPTLLGALVRERLLDELFLTLAPRLAGDEASASTVRDTRLPQPAELELCWALEHQGELMLRYALR